MFSICSFFTSSADHRDLHSFPTRRSSDLSAHPAARRTPRRGPRPGRTPGAAPAGRRPAWPRGARRSEEHTSELQSRRDLVCRLLLEKKKITCALDFFVLSHLFGGYQ